MRAAAAVFLVLAGCGASRPRGPMSDSERLYNGKCSSCHRLYEPAEHTPAQWEAAIDKMEALKKVHLQPEERALILGYLGGKPLAPGP